MVCDLHHFRGHNLITPHDVFAQLVSAPWEALVMRERQGCRSASIRAIQDTWVIDVSVGCALGAWTVLSALSLVTADDCLLAGPPRCAFPPSLGFRHANEGE